MAELSKLVAFARRVVVGVADFAVSKHPETVLSTYALGSCISVVAYDPAAKTGGLLHLMLPESSLAPEKAHRLPAMFANTGIPIFLKALQEAQTDFTRARLFIAGGACVLSGPDSFKIGERNIAAVHKLLAAEGIQMLGEDVGGTVNRTLHLHNATGLLTIKLPDRTVEVFLI